MVLAGALLPVLVSTTAADANNLLANPSVETVTGSTPTSWTADNWGTSTTNMSLSSDAHSGSYALNISTTSRTDGDAKWVPDAVAVTAGQQYTYQDYSKSTVATQIDAAFITSAGAVSYV